MDLKGFYIPSTERKYKNVVERKILCVFFNQCFLYIDFGAENQHNNAPHSILPILKIYFYPWIAHSKVCAVNTVENYLFYVSLLCKLHFVRLFTSLYTSYATTYLLRTGIVQTYLHVQCTNVNSVSFIYSEKKITLGKCNCHGISYKVLRFSPKTCLFAGPPHSPFPAQKLWPVRALNKKRDC